MSGVTAGTIAAYAAIAGAAVSAYSSYTTSQAAKKNKPLPPPAAPEAPPLMQDPQISSGGEATRRKAIAAGGIMSNIATSSQGVIGGASTTGKTLLGM